jgi:hypothetical protein
LTLCPPAFRNVEAIVRALFPPKMNCLSGQVPSLNEPLQVISVLLRRLKFQLNRSFDKLRMTEGEKGRN